MIIDSGVVTGSLQVSGSFSVLGATTLNGSISIVSGSISGSIDSASYASTASHVNTLNQDVLVTGILQTTSTLFATTGSLGRLVADHLTVNPANIITGSIQTALLAYNANTASLAPDYLPLTGGTITGDLNVNGTASLSYLNVVFESASVIYSSGSNQFGDASNDTQTLFGTVDIKNGPVLVTGSLNVSNGITGNLAGTASYALSAMNALTASYVNIAQTSSYILQAVSASYATQADLALQANTATSAPYYVTTASYNADSASVSTRVTNLETWSSSLDTGYVTNAELNASSSALQAGVTSSINVLSSSVAPEIANLQVTSSILTSASASFAVASGSTSTRLTDLETWSSSLDTGYVTNAELNASSSALQAGVTASVNVLSSSVAPEIVNLQITSSNLVAASASFSTRVTDLETFSSSLDATFATNAELNASSSALQAGVTSSISVATTNLQAGVTSSINVATTNLQAGVTSSINVATTNLQAGVSASIDIATGSLQAGVSASIDIATGSLQAGVTSSINELSSSLAVSIQQNTATGSSLVAASASFSTRVTELETTASNLTNASASFAVVSSSFATTSGSLSNRTTNLETTASNLTNASASFSTRTTNLETTASNLTNASASFSTRVTELEATESILVSASASFSTRVTELEATESILVSASASFAVVSSSFATTSGSLSTRTTNLETTASNLTDASASFSTRVSTIEGADATTGSNTFTGTQYVNNTTNPISFTSTAALYTDGGLRVTKDTYVSGGLYVAGDFTVYGTASVNYVTTSVFVGLEYVDLNTDLPALRYAGIRVSDSGSVATYVTSSLLWDSQNDKWIYSNPSGSNYNGGMLISGPRSSALGEEKGTLNNVITKGQGGDHITSSQITDDGTTVSIPGNLQVTGSLYALNLTGSLNGSNLVAGSVANDKLTNSAITIAGTSTSLGGSITAATILTSTGVFSGSAQIPNASIANAQLANSSVTVTAGTGMSGGGAVALGSSVTLTNAGVTSNVAGTGISVSGATGAVTITNSDRGSSQSIFKNVAVSGQSTIVADGNDDTLTFANGTAITITTDATTDTVTITNSGVTAFNTRTGAVTLAAGDISGLNAGIFSGSAQIPAGSITNAQLANSTISGVALGSNLGTLTIGTGLSGTSYNGSGAVTIANTGVTSIVAGTGVTASSATGAVTVSIGQAVNVGSNVTFGNATTTNQFVTVSGGAAAINITGSATEGGASYIDFLRVYNNSAGATNPNKSFRVFNDGTFQIVNSAYTSTIFSFTDAGAFTAAADVTAFSDARLKENVNTITGALEKVSRLRGVTYNRIDLEDKSEKLGFIAQEVLEVIPQVVLGSEEETYSVSYGNITALHNEAIKELKAEVEELKALVNQLLNK